MRTTTTPIIALAAALAASPARAQDTPTASLPDHPVLRHANPTRWTINAQVTLFPHREHQRDVSRYRNRVVIDRWDVDSMSVVFPFITTTANAVGGSERLRGQLYTDARLVDDTPTPIGPYQGQAMYARYEALDQQIDGFRLVQEQDLVCYETLYDETAALALPWPDAWPPDADSTFQPQQLISEVRSAPTNDGPVNDLLRSWTNNQDPRSIPPAQLAKFLAAKVWDHVRIVRPAIDHRPSDSGVFPVNTADDGRSSVVGRGSVAQDVGFAVQPAEETATSAQGSENDLAILLTAVYRAAGLPARLVIGYRERLEDREDLSRSERHRTWVEFALYDPAANDARGQLLWIPVDIVELKKSSSRARPIDQTWKYFGTHDELDDTVPLATHFHPPTTVRSYAVPALYGWTTVPEPPEQASQGIVFNISRTPTSGSTRPSP